MILPSNFLVCTAGRWAIRTRNLLVLGTDKLDSYLKNTIWSLIDPQLQILVGRHSRKAWSKFINGDNQHWPTIYVIFTRDSDPHRLK
ncbi:hypothetical protein ZOSMA_87G00880 [Zostera marina]|uniref:Uncharacterized protein n=1 Tax=Zostera marina TaxID=29655 RepID=A0A0K9NMN7_ZOSMR|nr:hypothetical protein ZOSMA_87G00880 [Zostera marina]